MGALFPCGFMVSLVNYNNFSLIDGFKWLFIKMNFHSYILIGVWLSTNNKFLYNSLSLQISIFKARKKYCKREIGLTYFKKII